MSASKRPHFDAVVACSGLSRSFDAIEWYYVPRPSFHVPGQGNVEGWWDGGRRIYLSSVGWYRGALVRHEVLHYLRGEPGHPKRLFGSSGRCARELHG